MARPLCSLCPFVRVYDFRMLRAAALASRPMLQKIPSSVPICKHPPPDVKAGGLRASWT
jgi:hypothetical protein